MLNICPSIRHFMNNLCICLPKACCTKSFGCSIKMFMLILGYKTIKVEKIELQIKTLNVCYVSSLYRNVFNYDIGLIFSSLHNYLAFVIYS